MRKKKQNALLAKGKIIQHADEDIQLARIKQLTQHSLRLVHEDTHRGACLQKVGKLGRGIRGQFVGAAKKRARRLFRLRLLGLLGLGRRCRLGRRHGGDRLALAVNGNGAHLLPEANGRTRLVRGAVGQLCQLAHLAQKRRVGRKPEQNAQLYAVRSRIQDRRGKHQDLLLIVKPHICLFRDAERWLRSPFFVSFSLAMLLWHRR